MTDLAPVAAIQFDFSVPAELYIGRGVPRRHGLRFKQFETAAEAIRYAMEQPRGVGELATMECADQRYSTAEIAELYQADAYPLTRLAVTPKPAVRPTIAVPSMADAKREARQSAAAAAPSGEVAKAAHQHHRYKIGARLQMHHGGNLLSRQASNCRVTFVLPYEGGRLLYRVKSDVEAFERVVSEADLSPMRN